MARDALLQLLAIITILVHLKLLYYTEVHPPRRSLPSASPPSAASTTPKKTSTQTSTAAPKSSPKAAPANEDELFAQARRQASEDTKVAELRIKADEAKSKDAASAATKAYLKSLYSKMRSIEPSLKDRIDLTEAAALKGLDSPK